MNIRDVDAGLDSREVAYHKLVDAIDRYLASGGEIEDIRDLIDRREGTILVRPENIVDDWGNYADKPNPIAVKLAQTIHQLDGAVETTAPSTLVDVGKAPEGSRSRYLVLMRKVRTVGDLWKKLETDKSLSKWDLDVAKKFCDLAALAGYMGLKVLIEDGVDLNNGSIDKQYLEQVERSIADDLKAQMPILKSSKHDVKKIWMKISDANEDAEIDLVVEYPYISFVSLLYGVK